MKQTDLRRLRLLGLGAFLTPFLTACPKVPTPPPGINLTFSYPVQADATGLMLAAIVFTDQGVQVVGSGYGSSSYGAYSSPAPAAKPASSNSAISPATTPFYQTVNSLYLDGYSLQRLQNGTVCQSFKATQDKTMQQVSVTPADVRTCYIYFVAYRDANGNRMPESGEEVYITHDVLANASSDFTYTAISADGRSRESGSLKKDWTLVRHTVLQPSSTPGQYLVSMNSVPASDQGVAIPMHAPSTYLTSMGLPGAGLTSTGGAK